MNQDIFDTMSFDPSLLTALKNVSPSLLNLLSLAINGHIKSLHDLSTHEYFSVIEVPSFPGIVPSQSKLKFVSSYKSIEDPFILRSNSNIFEEGG